jgi:hypothetical protein
VTALEDPAERQRHVVADAAAEVSEVGAGLHDQPAMRWSLIRPPGQAAGTPPTVDVETAVEEVVREVLEEGDRR